MPELTDEEIEREDAAEVWMLHRANDWFLAALRRHETPPPSLSIRPTAVPLRSSGPMRTSGMRSAALMCAELN